MKLSFVQETRFSVVRAIDCDTHVYELEFDADRELCVGHRLKRPKEAIFDENKEGELKLKKVRNASGAGVPFGFKVRVQFKVLYGWDRPFY